METFAECCESPRALRPVGIVIAQKEALLPLSVDEGGDIHGGGGVGEG